MQITIEEIIDVVEYIENINSDCNTIEHLKNLKSDLLKFKKSKNERKKELGNIILDRFEVILAYTEDKNIILSIENLQKHMINLINNIKNTRVRKIEKNETTKEFLENGEMVEIYRKTFVYVNDPMIDDLFNELDKNSLYDEDDDDVDYYELDDEDK